MNVGDRIQLIGGQVFVLEKMDLQGHLPPSDWNIQQALGAALSDDSFKMASAKQQIVNIPLAPKTYKDGLGNLQFRLETLKK